MSKKEYLVKDLSELVGGELVGDGQKKISSFCSFKEAGPGQITFFANPKKMELLEKCEAGAVLVFLEAKEVAGLTLIKVADPYLASAIIQNHLLKTPFTGQGVHKTAVVDPSASYPEQITIGANVVIGAGARLGERVTIGPGTVIDENVVIGDDCRIFANVTISRDCVLGRRVTIHPGTVVGSDGYGYATDERGCHIKRPQQGIVQIDDDVEIGANCCIDRATFGKTWIKSGTKIDNLVQVAHNVEVGENCLLVAQVGLSGSTILGRNVVMGGQAATSGHLRVGDGVMLAARGAIHNDQPAGVVLGGAPAIDARQWKKSCAVYNSLPQLRATVRANARAIKEIQKEIEDGEDL